MRGVELSDGVRRFDQWVGPSHARAQLAGRHKLVQFFEEAECRWLRGDLVLAQALVISPETARNHTEDIYVKTGATSRVEARLFAIRHGLLEASPT